VVVSFLGILLLAATSFGQNSLPSGNLYGTVIDEQGASLREVTAKLSGLGAPQTTASDAKGDFHFLNLSPGAYSVTLEHVGFTTVRRDVSILLGKNSVFSVTMPIGRAAEAVTVSGRAPVVDSRKTETGATYGQKELQSIPTTRDPAAILRQVPGVLLFNVNVGGEDSLFQPGFVGKGSHSDQNTYNVDGVGITEAYGGIPIYFDFDSLETIGVVTGGTDPSLTTPGVTVNLVTKRGTDQVLGSARVLYTETAGWDYGVEAGGPLWRDRLWLWGAFARDSLLGQTIFNAEGQSVQFKPTVEHWNAKLNGQIAAANSLALSYLGSYKTNPANEAGFDRSQASTVSQALSVAAYRVEDSQVFSPKLFASLYLSYLPVHNTNTPNGGLDKQAYIDVNNVWQNSFSFYDSHRPQYQAGVTASGFFDTGDLRHELKFGFGYKELRTDSISTYPGNQLVGNEAFNPPLAAITRPANSKIVENYYDAYVGDTAQVGNLTINVGTRFDYLRGKNLPSSVAANPVFPELVPAVQYRGDAGYPITWRALEPRVGATYAVGNDRKTLLRASYSRFASRLGTEPGFIGAVNGITFLAYGWNDTNGNHTVDPGEIDFSNFLFASGIDRNNPASVVSVNRIASKTKPVTTDELIVGVEREILPDLSAALAYTHRSARDFAFAPIIGTSRSSYYSIGNAAGSATASDGFALNFSEPYYGLAACPAASAGCAGLFGENRPDFTQTYSGVELQLVKRLSHGWMLRTSFAYNDWQQQVGPGAIVDPDNLAGGTNASGPVVEGVGDKFGTIYINAKWQFNVSGMVQLPLGVEAAANLFGRQGYPIVYFVQAFTHDAANSAPLLQIGQIGAHRLPNVFLLDLHVERPFRIGSTVTASPMLDCFNVANSHTVLQRDGFVGTYDAEATPAFSPALKSNGEPSVNQPLEFLGSRAFRGGARIAF